MVNSQLSSLLLPWAQHASCSHWQFLVSLCCAMCERVKGTAAAASSELPSLDVLQLTRLMPCPQAGPWAGTLSWQVQRGTLQGTWGLHAWPPLCRQHRVLCCREGAALKEREALQAAARAGQTDQLERHLRHLQQQLAGAVGQLGHSRQLQLDLAGKRCCFRLMRGCSSHLACHAHTLAAVWLWPVMHLLHRLGTLWPCRWPEGRTTRS